MSRYFSLVCDDPSCDVILTDSGPEPIDVVKLLHRRTGLSLWGAKSLVSRLPATLVSNVSVEVADDLVNELRTVGACAHAEVLP
ncbi:ribosomal protein L7/L12 [Streptomyces xanthii]|uniref:Ribosomal protein L7/L12 n=1 Tax=Streptomyces xanthii TaxID=2768069 RepID=A0A7H1B0U8_9ACTN|nr:ribosomal protein L7/L12 [Streptomyces xanthii]QNS02353.1 ribosomal protein L7/L12 [Streptomyces xanthii]